MSQTAYATLYSCDQRLIDLDVVAKCLPLLDAKEPFDGAVLPVFDDWRASKEETGQTPEMDDFNSLSEKQLLRRISEKNHFFIDIRRSRALDDVLKSVRENLAFVAGSHYPGNLSLHVGWHDIFDWCEHEEGLFYGRASLSVSFWGWQLPVDVPGYRDKFFELPEVRSLREKLEAVIGQMEQCVRLEF